MDLSVKINRRDGNMAAKRKKNNTIWSYCVCRETEYFFFFVIWGFSQLIGKYY